MPRIRSRRWCNPGHSPRRSRYTRGRRELRWILDTGARGGPPHGRRHLGWVLDESAGRRRHFIGISTLRAHAHPYLARFSAMPAEPLTVCHSIPRFIYFTGCYENYRSQARHCQEMVLCKFPVLALFRYSCENRLVRPSEQRVAARPQSLVPLTDARGCADPQRTMRLFDAFRHCAPFLPGPSSGLSPSAPLPAVG